MPYGGPAVPVAAPPLFPPPTGLLQAATIIEHPLLETPGYLAKMVGPDAPDTVLASAIMGIAAEMFPDAITAAGEHYDDQKVIESLTYGERDALRGRLLELATQALVASPFGGLEEGGDSGTADPFGHWLAGVKWLPENAIAPELFDPCTDDGSSLAVFSAGSGSGSSGVSRAAQVAGQAFGVGIHDSCSTWGWSEADYVGRAQRGLIPKETFMVEKEYLHGDFMGAARAANGTADGHLTNGSPNATSATADFTQADKGKVITSNVAGIPAGTKILTVTDNHTIVLDHNFTGTTSTTAVFTVQSTKNGTNRYLSDANCVTYNTGSEDPGPIEALAYANEAIARANIGLGMIHVSAFFVEQAQALGYSFAKDARGRLTTLNGNVVVPGNGYDGVGPDGTGGSADDTTKDATHSGHSHEWIYVSDLPIIWRPPRIEIFPATMREAMLDSLNEVTFRATRPYVIVWSALLQIAIKTKVTGL